MRKIHLICNAHLDPVWLWQRAEGIGEALSTFKIAADFCEKYDGFVFNHNESVLYEWIKDNDETLFKRIQNLVRDGKWRIMGGWYLQTDVLMPCGESVIRQINVGNDFFTRYFGKIPKTAIGFDAFGHSRGLVQILKKCGYDNYAYLRPRERKCGVFVWQGFDNSEINTLKLYEWYNTPKGEALERVIGYNRDFPTRRLNALTWGIGNHGGGPSEKDLNDINDFAERCSDTEIIHSDFDSYFDELDKSELKTVDTSLVHCMVGCYTSMARVKQGHRRLENMLSLCEEMLWQSGIKYDERDLNEAEKALLFCEFHDILPGTAIKKVENDALNLIGFGKEILDRLITRSFFALCRGQKKAKTDEIPVMIYNPHPYPLEADFEVEFQLAEQNDPNNGVIDVKVRNTDNEYVPCQIEQEDSAHGMDWRKKVVFHTVAAPMSITRFDCELELNKNFMKKIPHIESGGSIILKNKRLEIKFDKYSGTINEYLYNGKEVIKSIKIKAFRDNADPWGMEVDSFDECIGEFKPTEPPRVIENGDVRTKIQSVLKYNNSSAVMTYTFSKYSDYLDINIRVLSNDENVMYKLCVETNLDRSAKAYCQTMFGTEETRKSGLESVFQKWCGLKDDTVGVSVLNSGTYGGSFADSEIRLSLLRTPVYSAHPVDGVELAPDDREYNHIDIGERYFDFRLCINEEFVDASAEIFNRPPLVLAYFPSISGKIEYDHVRIDNRHVIMSALKKFNGGTMIRLYNSSDKPQKCSVIIGKTEFAVSLSPFEVKTFIVSDGKITETDMLGRTLCD